MSYDIAQREGDGNLLQYFFFISHSSILAWEIPRTKEPRGLQFIGSQKEQDTTWKLKGNYIQYPMISHNGKEYTYKYI